MIEAPILVLLDFDKMFKVECDASNVDIGFILSLEGKPIGLRNEKLNEAKGNYLIDDKEFYTIVCALDHWSYYLFSKEFILYFDHENLRYLNTQHKLNICHAKMVEFLQPYIVFVKHRCRNLNKVADALSTRHYFLSTMKTKVLGFEVVKELYANDLDFSTL